MIKTLEPHCVVSCDIADLPGVAQAAEVPVGVRHDLFTCDCDAIPFSAGRGMGVADQGDVLSFRCCALHRGSDAVVRLRPCDHQSGRPQAVKHAFQIGACKSVAVGLTY